MAVAKSEYLIEVKVIDGKTQATINGVKVSLKDLNKVLKDIKSSSSAASSGIANVGGAAEEASKKNQDLISSAGLAGATLTEFGRFISDLPFGITAVTNNLSQLSSLMVTLVAKTNGTGRAFALLGKQLMGPLGIVLIFQVVIALVQAFQKELISAIFKTEELNQATKEATKSFDDLRKKLEENNPALKEEQEEFQKLIDKFLDMRNTITLANGAIDRDSDFYKSMLLLKKTIEDTYGIVIDFTDPKTYQRLREAKGPLDLVAERLVNLQTAIDVAEIKGTKTPAELAQMRLDLFIETQEQLKVAEEVYIKDPRYLKLVARVERAKMDAEKKASNEKRQERIDAEVEQFEKEYQQILDEIAARKRVMDEFAAAARADGEPLFIEEGGVEDFEFALSEFDDFLSKFVTKKEKYDEIAEQAALDRVDQLALELEGFVDVEESKDRVREFFASKREQAQRRETNQLIREINARTKIQMAYVNTLSSFAGLLDELGEQSKAAKIAGIIAEQAAGIGSIIINTSAANAKAVAAFPLTAGQPFVTLNKISAALGIASSILAARNAIKGIKSGQATSTSSVPSGGGAAPQIQAPDFNVVGASQTSQLAETVAGQQAKPVRAFVVGKDISTQQELDRNITNTASL